MNIKSLIKGWSQRLKQPLTSSLEEEKKQNKKNNLYSFVSLTLRK